MIFDDKETINLNLEKAELIKERERYEAQLSETETNYKNTLLDEGNYLSIKGDITERLRVCKTRLNEVYAIIDARNREMVNDKISQIIKSEVKGPMAEEKKVKEGKEVKAGKRENSIAGLVVKALQMRSVKNVADVVARVKEWSPAAKEKTIKTQAGNVIRAFKKGTYKAKEYKWDDANFQLNKIE